MKVLQINKYITLNGGAESVVHNLGLLLEERGHIVESIGFTIDGQKGIDKSISLGDSKKNVIRFFYDRKMCNNIVRLINDKGYDTVITHNIYHDFPHAQLLSEIKKRTNAKLIGFLHDYKAVCPSYLLYDGSRVCEDCSKGKYLRCFFRRCKKNRLESLILSMDSIWNIKIKKAYNYYDLLISPSSFLKDKICQMGLVHPNIEVIHNPIESDWNRKPKELSRKERKILYAGRLTKEKGILDLLHVAKRMPDIDFIIAGDGPLYGEAKKIAQGYSNIFVLGMILRNEVISRMMDCAFLVLPSIWYENNPMIALEAMAYGLPVIGANIGGISELLEEGRGLLVRPNDPVELEEIIRKAFEMPDSEYLRMIKRADEYIADLSFDKYYKELMGKISSLD